MNPVFWILIVIGLVILWFIISSFAFIPLGQVLSKRWRKTVEILIKETEENDETEEKDKNE